MRAGVVDNVLPHPESGQSMELCNKRETATVISFADDVQCCVMRENQRELEEGMMKTAVLLEEYCGQHRLKMNASKTHFLQIESSQRRGAHGHINSLTFGGKVVGASRSERILGLQVSRTLFQWKEQVDKVLEEVAVVINGLKRGAQYLNFKQRLATAKACHFSRLFYSVEVWGHGLTRNQVQSLQSAQNKVLRWVTDTPPRTSSRENIVACGVLTVRQTIIYRTLIAGMRIIFDKRPVNLYQALVQAGGNQVSEDELVLVEEKEGFYEDRHWRNVFLKVSSLLPVELRVVADPRKQQVKRMVREWVRGNVPFFAGE